MTITAASEDEAIPTASATPIATEVVTALDEAATTLVRVIAPASLPGGATFEAVVDGIRFVAEVPPQGVSEGDSFLAPHPSGATAAANVSAAAGNHPARIRVRAPEDLNEGDMFEASIDGIRFLAVVPSGGIRRGGTFEVDYPTTNPSSSSRAAARSYPVPTGRWRTALHQACSCGLPCVVATCLHCVVFAQVVQRLGLPVGGCRRKEGIPNPRAWQNVQVCRKIVVLSAVAYGLGLFGFLGSWAFDDDIYVLAFFVAYALWALLLVVLVCARRSMREMYFLPETCCGTGTGCCDDCCVTLLCPCCSALQMAFHTHDPREHPYELCSPTGLGPEAPLVV